MLPLENLSPTEFEELCYELLVDLGATEISWRKGALGDASPADQGRDIECSFLVKSPDGESRSEKWFVECKHHTRAVSADKLMNAITWASAEQPDVLLLACSGFLSNPAKEHLEAYVRKNRLGYKLRTWENKDIERLVMPRPRLQNKFKIGPVFPHVEHLHPAHLAYLRKPAINTLAYFFSLCDKWDHEIRDDLLGNVYHELIRVTFREPVSGHETMRDLMQGPPLTYNSFKKRCLEMADEMPEEFLVRSIVASALSWGFFYGDKTAVNEWIEKHRSSITFFENDIKKQPEKAELLRGIIAKLEKMIADLPARTERGYKNYCSFCDVVLLQLIFEVPEPPTGLMDKIANLKD
jgi:hypothetical protein